VTLDEIRRLLQPLGIRWWLQGGGLVTMYRDNYLKPTLDWDMGIFAEDLSPTVIKKIQKSGLYIRNFWKGPKDQKIGFSTVNPNLINELQELDNWDHSQGLDFYCFYKDTKLKKYYYSEYPYWDDNNENLFRCYHTPFDIDYYNYEGFDVPIPSNTELFLEETYGEDWRVPVDGPVWIYEYPCSVETTYKKTKDYTNNFIGVLDVLNRNIGFENKTSGKLK
tara:strand:+ start:132 stop:794 length:663 start_codon:yes stop_codon:yes gene_type:complete